MIILLTTVLVLLSLVWFFDGLRLRKRSQAMHLLVSSPQGQAPSEDFVIIPKATAHPDLSMRKSAILYAATQGLEALLVTADSMKTSDAMLSLQTVDVAKFRRERLASARMQGEFFVVRKSLLERMDLDVVPPKTGKDFAKLAGEFKKYASATMGLATMRGLPHSGDYKLAVDPVLLRYYFGGIGAPWILMQLIFLGLGFIYVPVVALLALAAYLAQPLIALYKTPLAGKDLFAYAWLRPFLDAKTMLLTFVVKDPDARTREMTLAEKRLQYRDMLESGTGRFFEARRRDCPICGGEALERFISTKDRFQFKPGVFHMDRCEDCSHIFQNPRLSIEGLEFYYKDFYDGLGEERLDGIFSHGDGPYLARARMMEGKGSPSRWLDVGGGHGHFCLLAREVFPGTKFDGLDLASSVVDAEKMGWTDRSYRGLFPELADSITKEASYDVISMSHYLEHTRDPALEIEAAAKVLPEGGHLLIELPDPESRFGKIFKSFWLPWFQPQHQHFLSATNLERLLKENKFEPVTWHRGEAHHPIDIMFSVGLMVTQVAKPLDLPWLPARDTWLRRIFNQVIFVASVPLLIVSRVLDLSLAPFLRRPGWANAYRVLARRSA